MNTQQRTIQNRKLQKEQSRRDKSEVDLLNKTRDK